MGIPLLVSVAGASDAAALEAAFRGWQGEPQNDDPPLRLQLTLTPGAGGLSRTHVEVAGSMLRITGVGIDGRADAQRRRASCTIAQSWLAAPNALREQVLEPLLLFLLTRSGRVPVHASGFDAGGLGVILAGPSGAGKSSLALAADESGLQVLSEDTVYVQLSPGLRIWGWPDVAHLLPGDASGFRDAGTRLRNGRLKQVVPLRSAGKGSASTDRASLCILARGTTPTLERLDPEAAMQALEPLEPGFDLLAGAVRAAHAALTRNGAWRLTLSPDPREGLALLLAALPRLRATAVP